MLLLAIDTSTSTGSIALRGDAGIVGLLTASVDLTHSEGLMPAVDNLLRRTGRTVDEITALACVAGPGSYTGLRVGVATAQGLALAKNLPCVGISSLDTLAWALPHARYPICPLLPARKGWLYARLYRWEGDAPQPLTEELYVEPDELIRSIQEPTILYGPGLEAYRRSLQEMLGEQFVSAPDVCNLPRADIAAELAARELLAGRSLTAEHLLPYYLGPSQAEINWKRRQAEPPPTP
jgi:tRNA threonylcarbamoyladenosine biosynthesis protein TsaB